MAIAQQDIVDLDVVPNRAQQIFLELGFVIIPTHSDQMWDLYEDIEDEQHSAFITTDAVLHCAHIFFDYSLRILENRQLYQSLDKLVRSMAEQSRWQYETAQDSMLKELARLNWAFFTVPIILLQPEYNVDDEIEELVEAEIDLIMQHKGSRHRPLLSYIPDTPEFEYAFEDYSQYVPRGHYTRNDKFERYFRAMMWLGRIDFKLCPGDSPDERSHGMKMTIQALLITDALFSLPESKKLWDTIYQITEFYVGKADDITPEDFYNLADKIFADSKDISKYADTIKVYEFIKQALELRKPTIASNLAVMDTSPVRSDLATMTQSFRFMGQRFIPDSYIFQRMVWHIQDDRQVLNYTGDGTPFTMETIPNVGPARAFPRGLDVMAVLGSNDALEILKKEGDTEYTYYMEILTELQNEFADLPDSIWMQNLYWQWFGTLKTLLNSPMEGVPEFMKSALWNCKMLITALASWTELRHDTILYAKQSYTPMLKAAMPVPQQSKKRNPRPYVEPYPQLFQKIGTMMRTLQGKLEMFDIQIPELTNKVQEFEQMCSYLSRIALKQLGGGRISEKDYNKLQHLGSEMKKLFDFPPKLMSEIGSQTDEKMDVIADVHTVVFKKQVLQEGVGAPFHIYVLVDDIDGKRVCHGAMFSYYEFKWDMSDRLTDEKWQEICNRRHKFRPNWTNEFILKQ